MTNDEARELTAVANEAAEEIAAIVRKVAEQRAAIEQRVAEELAAIVHKAMRKGLLSYRKWLIGSDSWRRRTRQELKRQRVRSA